MDRVCGVVPLISLPMDSTMEQCDQCGSLSYLGEIVYIEGAFLCGCCARPTGQRIIG
jgi:hypothetical protein